MLCAVLLTIKLNPSRHIQEIEVCLSRSSSDVISVKLHHLQKQSNTDDAS